MSDEQRVRTMCGWIGVEISRSRVRTQGKAGYGLYRIRGSVSRAWIETRDLPRSAVTPDLHGERGPWTGYAYALEEVERAAKMAIAGGNPARPGVFAPAPYGDGRQALAVPARWTPAYRGRRDLGGGVPVALRPEVGAELESLVFLVDAGLREIEHDDDCACDGDRYAMSCLRRSMTGRMRQRGENREFQEAHLERRKHGLERRHAEKLARNAKAVNEAPSVNAPGRTGEPGRSGRAQ